jgi:hypothetical protein
MTLILTSISRFGRSVNVSAMVADVGPHVREAIICRLASVDLGKQNQSATPREAAGHCAVQFTATPAPENR